MIIPEEETLVAIFIYLLYKQSQLREIKKKRSGGEVKTEVKGEVLRIVEKIIQTMSVKRRTWQDSRGGKEELLRCWCLGAGWHWKADTGRVDQEWSAQPIQGWQRWWCGRLLAKGRCVRSLVEEVWEQFLHVEFHFGTGWDRPDEGCYPQPKSELDMKFGDFMLCFMYGEWAASYIHRYRWTLTGRMEKSHSHLSRPCPVF